MKTQSNPGPQQTQRWKIVLSFLVVMGVLVVYRLNWHDLIVTHYQKKHLGLQAEGSSFKLGGSNFQILGGSIHYFRVPKEYWSDSLLKLKACGLNTLTTYVPWNLHEPERGKFNFSGNLDLEYVLTAK